MSVVETVHARALDASASYRRAEGELIEVVELADRYQVFLDLGYASLYVYVTDGLRLGENVAYSLITVARKSREVPELQACVREGRMTLSNARRVVAVLNQENQAEWLEKACTLSNRLLEKEIVRVRPRAAVQERVSYINPEAIRLEVGLNERSMLRLRHAQDLLCQKLSRPADLAETIEAMTSFYLERHDPVARAKRQVIRKGRQSGAVFGKGSREGSGGHQGGNEQMNDTVVKPRGGGKRVASHEDGTLVSPTEANELVASPQDTPFARTVDDELVTSKLDVAFATEKERDELVNPGSGSPTRIPIPESILHEVNLRDQRRCTFTTARGRCSERRWTAIHHVVPVSGGGSNEPENLATLCGIHHRAIHRAK